MFLGQSKIIKRSKLDESIRTALLSGRDMKFFIEPETEVDHAILSLLDIEGYDYSDKLIEYWFQYKSAGEDLPPHCDYNYHARLKGDIANQPLEMVMSPVTIACYLEVDDMIGGELCISDLSWLDHDFELGQDRVTQLLKNYCYETITPVQGDILYFEGSRYYHWIKSVQSGHRVSVLINFWPHELTQEN